MAITKHDGKQSGFELIPSTATNLEETREIRPIGNGSLGIEIDIQTKQDQTSENETAITTTRQEKRTMTLTPEQAIENLKTKKNKNIKIEDFITAGDALAKCDQYSPQAALDNATYLEFTTEDTNKLEQIGEIKKYLKYVIETKTKNRAKDGICKTIGKWKYDIENETEDMMEKEVENIKKVLEKQKAAYEQTEPHTKGNIKFSILVNRAIKELETNKTQWKPKAEKETGRKKITQKMKTRFFRVAQGKTIKLPESNVLHKIRGDQLDETVKNFIIQHGKRDDFEDIVSNLIRND